MDQSRERQLFVAIGGAFIAYAAWAIAEIQKTESHTPLPFANPKG